MYNLPYFKAKDQEQVLAFMHKNPFIILTGCDEDNAPVATHLPVLIKEREGKLYLQGHFMKQTDHHKAFLHNGNALAVFTGPHTYVSASWYKDKKQASTWNYMTVHAKGFLQFMDEAFLQEVLKETTAQFENDDNSPSLFEHLEPDYVARLSKAVIAFEIEVTAIDHVFKLSQNKDEETYKKIVEKLSQGDMQAQAVAGLMKDNR